MGLLRGVAGLAQKSVAQMTMFGLRAVLGNLEIQRRLNWDIDDHWRRKRTRIANPIVDAGGKYFSQNDEDGILMHIFDRLSMQRGVFVEFGVGDGLENNTLLPLMNGWKGAWIGGEPLSIALPATCTRLGFVQDWITRENCVDLMRKGLGKVGASEADLISIDLDGNDLYILEAILDSGARPTVVVVEYNGKFPPPIRFCVTYDPSFRWDGSDYFGASLQSYVEVLSDYGYHLVCCNVTGLNAFFVAGPVVHLFPEACRGPKEHFVAADYCGFLRAGHPASNRTVEAFLK